ncbi:uncharacterized protein PgNI_00220 [Pyricularia grisea]|uniref:SET domain-containing protein n=1 Tax=Pyricularia grisea TaxID=148305 RepID=A0A6P8BHC9_PYRGI|nr:uncharacterized protein PgNI_00220 [Pyricularia grisea]TLD16173.1 hypothetical protein PgNI_00220 [Pyricularia grisea]
MSAHADFSPEFDLVDSDEGPLSYLEFINSDDPDSLHAYEASRAADSKAVLTPAPNPPPISNPASSPESPSPSFPDSSSESSSSKQTGGMASAKPGFAAGDVMMDGLEFTGDWKVEDFLHTEDDNSIATDGTINPLSIENPFGLDPSIAQSSFEFQSPASTPSPFASGASEQMTSPRSPNGHANGPPKYSKSSEVSKVNGRGHNKAMSQYSLTQSMCDLKTKSREVSPTSNMVFSQDSSPSAMLNNSPSPAGIDFISAAGMGIPGEAALFAGFSFTHGLQNAPNQNNGNMPAVFPNQQIPPSVPGQPPFPMYQQPLFGSGPPCRLTINQTPLKSRVETQIPVKLTISPLPPGIKRLHLPRHTISKPKLIAKPWPERSPDMLELTVMLVCTSAMQNPEVRKRALARAAAASSTSKPGDGNTEAEKEELKPQDGGEVHICPGCITRERKRAARKKAKKPEEEENWTRDEHRRVVVFNTHEIKEWQDPNAPGPKAAQSGHYLTSGVIDAPMRIACYCRHHQEKGGFRVIFTIKDHMDKLIAQQLSESIMITDDHKTPHTAQATNSQSAQATGSDPSLIHGTGNPVTHDAAAPSPGASVPGSSHSHSEVPASKSVTFPSGLPTPQQPQHIVQTPRNLSRPVSPNGSSGPSAKKRKSSGGMTKVPSGLAMTRIETSQSPGACKQTGNGQMNSAMPSATSPFTPNLSSFSISAESMFGNGGTPNGGNIAQPFNGGPPTPNGNDQVLFATGNGAAGLDNLSMAQLYSAPGSAHPSRAPSPNSLRNNSNASAAHQQQSQSHLERALANGIYNLPMNMAQPRTQLSVIHKIIPNEGPKSGGIEVTILGGGFYQGLEVMFGDQKATTTTFWGESSLVCLLPPSPVSGAVLVTFKQNGQTAPQQFTSATKHQPIFKYVDDDEQQLMRTALSVLGHKMTGKIEDVRDVARRIIGGGNGDSSSWGNSNGNGGQGPVGGNYNGFSFNGATTESQLLKVLDLIDLDDSTHKARLNLQRRTGQTMLHLACSLGLHRFVAALLARGANPDARDKGGYTPLHIASLNNHVEIVRRLIAKGADPTMRTLSGLTAADMSQSRDILKAIRRLERHRRSHSGGSMHSRVSSATSLRSLWEPASAQPTAKEYTSEDSTSSGESPEYSENATSEDDSDMAASDSGGNAWLNMRRASTATAHEGNIAQPLDGVDGVTPPGLASPSAAVTAFREQCRDQFQHLQQAMAMRLPTLPQFPNYFSQMGPINFPGMPPLSEYQGYLNSAPVFQRISSLVPNIGGSDRNEPRPEQRRDLDGKWWDFSGLVNQSSAPPPAYDDIFPQKNNKDMDTKQESAARAAAEAEADMKCAIMYDEDSVTAGPSTSVVDSDEEQQPQQLPALLQIGRKNTITKEQQDNLRRAHAEKRKGLRSDRNLFMIWIPVLIVVLCATLYSRVPVAISVINSLFPPGGMAAAGAGAVGAGARSATEPVSCSAIHPPAIFERENDQVCQVGTSRYTNIRHNQSGTKYDADDVDSAALPGWKSTGVCRRLGRDEFCAFTKPSFNSGEGTSLITTRTMLDELAALFASDAPVYGSPAHDSWVPAESRPYAEVPVPGKGMGLRATQPIRVGHLVTARTPAVMVDGRALTGLAPHDLARLLVPAVGGLPGHHLAQFLDLSTHDAASDHMDKVHKIYSTNAYRTSIRHGVEFHSTFVEVSRMNHECSPNCAAYFDPGTMSQRIYAIRDIMPGEELTVSYIDPVQTRAARQSRLRKDWGFSCSCQRCTSEAHLGAESDARVEQIKSLWGELDDYSARPEAARAAYPTKAELLITLFRLEGLDNRIHEAYYRAALESNGAGDAVAATKYARLCLDRGLLTRGPSQPFMEAMRSLIVEPEKHWSWRFRVDGKGGPKYK